MEEDVRARVEDRSDLHGLYSRIKTHIPLIAACVVIFMALAAVATHFMPKKYTATAQLTYAPKASPVKTEGSSNQLSDEARDAEIEGQVQTLQSLDVARRVVATQKLDKDPEFVKAAEKFSRSADNRTDALAAAALENLKVRRAGQSPLIDVNYIAKEPLKAATLATAFSQQFFNLQVERKVAQSQKVSERLDSRVEALRKRVEAADAAVAKFRIANNLLSGVNSASPEQEIASIQTDLAMARAEAAEAAARRATAQNSIPGGGVNGPVNTNTISQLQQQKAEVERRVASLSSRYGDRHPALMDANKELTAINSQIGQEMSRIRQTTNSEATAAGSRAGSLSSSLAAAKGRVARNVAASVRLGDLQREADNLRQIYQNLLASSSEENARRSLVQPDISITSPASVPLKPSSPNLMLNLVGALIAGLAVGIGIAYVRERWSQGLGTVDDVSAMLGQNYLNSIPTLKSSVEKPKTTDPVAAIGLHPMSAYTEAFRNLGTSLVYAASGQTKGKVIGITSALPKEGKTTTSIAVARVLASSGQKVLLVDADLRRRSVTTTVAPQAAAGLNEVISGQKPLSQVLLKEDNGLEILPLAPEAHVGPMPFASDSFRDLVTQLRNVYDVILFDTAPILAVTDTRLLLNQFDALAVLTRWKSTPVRAVRAALHQIEAVGGKVTGVALTMVDLKRQSEAGYGDASYYYGYMKDYYASS